MIKKILPIFILMLTLFHIQVFSQENYKISLPNNFYTLDASPEKVADILGMTHTQLNDYTDSHSIDFLAVDSENKRQVKISRFITDFSSSVKNLNNLSNESISTLTPDISGIEGTKGNIITKNGQKHLEVQLLSKDGNNQFILTQYITVINGETVILSFYTDTNTDTEYINEIFESYAVNNYEEPTKENQSIKAIIIIATIIFASACLLIALSLINDVRKKSKN